MGQTKGQLRKERKHVRIYDQQVNTAAWRSLSGSAVKVWIAIGLFDNGSNNGEIYAGVRMLHSMTGLALNTVCKALAELQEKGFLYCSEPGGFSRKTPHAAKYGFTWIAGQSGSVQRAPTHAYAKWSPENQRSQFLTGTVSVCDEPLETEALNVAETETAETEKRLVSANHHLSETKTLTVSQGLGPAQLETEQRKQANSNRAAFLASLRTALRGALVDALPGAQTDIAQAAGIPGGTLSRFKKGGNLPDNYAAALARHLFKEAA